MSLFIQIPNFSNPSKKPIETIPQDAKTACYVQFIRRKSKCPINLPVFSANCVSYLYNWLYFQWLCSPSTSTTLRIPQSIHSCCQCHACKYRAYFPMSFHKMLEYNENTLTHFVHFVAETIHFQHENRAYGGIDSKNNIYFVYFSFPWNWQQPTGYLAAFCVECYWMQICALVVVCFLLFFSIFCVFFEAFVLDIKQSIADLSASVVFFDIRTASDRLRIKQRFSDIVQFHSHAKESVARII